jgi:hypothetical protein
MIVNQSNPRSIGQFIGHFARSFFKALGEAAQRLDELPLQHKQEIKEGLIGLLSRTGQNRASIRMLMKEDGELSRILSARGWWILPGDINGPVKRALIRLGQDADTSAIDRYLCSLFNENDAARLTERIEAWFKLPYLAERKQIILDSLDAHKAGKWTLTVPTLLPLVDGAMRRFRKEHLRTSKNANRAMHVGQFVAFYRRNQPKLFGKSLHTFMHKQVFAKFDFNNGVSPSSINRHAILHGVIFDYATEANSLKVFLSLDTISQFIQVMERRRRTSAGKRTKQLRLLLTEKDSPNIG